MADKMTFMGKWLDDIVNDPNLIGLDNQQLAYITYATVQYGLTGNKINMGEVFGKEFSALNFAMPNIYGQVDNIQSYPEKMGAMIRYDSDAICKLRLKGMTSKEICIELGYPLEKARSITSNKGWIEAGKILAKNKTENTKSVQKVQKCESDVCTESVQKVNEGVQNLTENVQKSDRNTESVQNLTKEEKNLFVQDFDF